MQRIVIKNFGPIKDVDIPIHDFVIFIGPQASGKSTIAKAIYFFRNDLTGSLFSSLLKLKKQGSVEEDKKRVFDNIIDKFHSAWKYYPTNLHEIQFFYNEGNWIKLKLKKFDQIEFLEGIELSPQLHRSLETTIGSINAMVGSLEDSKNTNFAYPGITRIVTDFLDKEFGISATTFIPAGRSVFSILANQIQLFEGDRIDETIKYFASEINDIREKRYPSRGLYSASKPIVQKAMDLYRSILKGSYIYDQKQDKIQLDDGVDITLEKASSGQQESLWPLLTLFNLIREQGESFIVFEEPEAHLYPEAQKYITELIALYINQSGNKIIITTHSPYILSALNNLLYANEVGQTHPDQVEKVVDKSLWLDYDNVMAYFVDEGTVRSIMDEELRLIKSEEIDSASRIINEEYGNLADIKYSK